MQLTASEIRIILEALRKQYGRGYSELLEVGRLQAKLSAWLEYAMIVERPIPALNKEPKDGRD